MAKGYDRDKQRKEVLSIFGKDLVRRSGAACELCEATGQKLSVFEVPPVTEEPDFQTCIFICEHCRTQLENPRHFENNHWRCLNNTVWSDVPAVQVMALRLLRKMSSEEDWANSLLEQVYPTEEVSAWVEKSE